MTEMQAMAWHSAENETGTSWMDLDEKEREKVRNRVKDVLMGNVLRREMGKGDLAIYEGRYRALSVKPPELKGSGECVRGVFWDSLPINSKTPASARLFGNASDIGYQNMTNLQVPGMFFSDSVFHIAAWHLTATPREGLYPDLEKLLTEGVAMLVVGDRPVATRRLVELWQEPWPVDYPVPPRQHTSMVINFFNHRLLEDFGRKVDYLEPAPHENPFYIRLNLEGWGIRAIV